MQATGPSWIPWGPSPQPRTKIKWARHGPASRVPDLPCRQGSCGRARLGARALPWAKVSGRGKPLDPRPPGGCARESHTTTLRRFMVFHEFYPKYGLHDLLVVMGRRSVESAAARARSGSVAPSKGDEDERTQHLRPQGQGLRRLRTRPWPRTGTRIRLGPWTRWLWPRRLRPWWLRSRRLWPRRLRVVLTPDIPDSIPEFEAGPRYGAGRPRGFGGPRLWRWSIARAPVRRDPACAFAARSGPQGLPKRLPRTR